jgi:hypothetical protein
MEAELVMGSDSKGASPVNLLFSFRPEFFVGATTYTSAATKAARAALNHLQEQPADRLAVSMLAPTLAPTTGALQSKRLTL